MKNITAAPQQRGFNLLEIVLVLAGFAIITVLSIKQYAHYRRHTEMAAIKSDITVMYQALNSYFHTIGCQSDNIFPIAYRNPSMTDLHLTASYTARPPLITRYATHIVASGTHTTTGKPIYLLEITATLTPALTARQLQWYRQTLNAAYAITAQRQLIWQTMPENAVSGSEQPFWILDGARKIFRNHQPIVIKQRQQGSLCAQ